MRQFICSELPDKKGILHITGKNYRYLVQVLRLRENDIIDVRLQTGELKAMSVISLSNKELLLVPIEKGKNEDDTKKVQGVSASQVDDISRAFPEMWLFQFMPRPQKMDVIVRQATECGVTKIVPIKSEFSVQNDCSLRVDRWERIIKEARQQSGSSISTQISSVKTVDEAAEMWKTATENTISRAFILHENPEETSVLVNESSVEKIAIGIGCEGGFSQKEYSVLQSVGFKPIHFITNILRAETAALYGIAVIQQRYIYKTKEEICNEERTN